MCELKIESKFEMELNQLGGQGFPLIQPITTVPTQRFVVESS